MSSYESIEIKREDGVAEVRFHTDGGALTWNEPAHREAGAAFAEVAGDNEVKVVIVTATGEHFCVGFDEESFGDLAPWETIWWEGKRLLKCLLDIDVPVIGAINGPALVHAEIPVLADLVLAADTTVLSCNAFGEGGVPGDGVHLIWPWLLGPRRGKHFLMTDQELSAEEALALGVVNEVVPAAELNARAWELARGLAEKPLPLLRYSREALNMFEREYLLNGLSHGLALEGVAMADIAYEARRAEGREDGE